MKWKSIWLKREKTVETLSAYPNLKKLGIGADIQTKLVANEVCNCLLDRHTPTIPSNTDD
jgi:hypothetical protein